MSNLTPEQIRQGEIAIAKWMGLSIQYRHMSSPYPEYEHYWGRDVLHPITKPVRYPDPDPPRFSSDWQAHGELIRALRDKALEVFMMGIQTYAYVIQVLGLEISKAEAEDPCMALFLAVLQIPEVQQHLPSTSQSTGGGE